MKKLYKFLLNNLPRPLLIRLSYPFKKVAPLLYKGNNVECPVCERSFSKFLSYGADIVHRDNVLCPYDLTLERHRLMWLYLKDESNFFTAEKLDVLHVHYAIPHASTAYMAKQILKSQGIHIPVITTLHGTDITLVGKDRSYEPVITFSIKQSDGITSVSEFLKQATYDYFPITKDIEVIPNFIDLDRFKKQKKDHFKLAICPNGEKLLVHTSNFRKVKRIEVIVLMFEKVRNEVPSKLHLVGDGPERNKIENLCRDLDLMQCVRFLGNLDAIEEVLSVADLFVMPSETESFGLAALEAMAVGVPVISSNTGGIPEVNVHGVTGYLSAVGNVDDMAQNALDILQSEERLNQFKVNAKKRSYRD